MGVWAKKFSHIEWQSIGKFVKAAIHMPRETFIVARFYIRNFRFLKSFSKFLWKITVNCANEIRQGYRNFVLCTRRTLWAERSFQVFFRKFLLSVVLWNTFGVRSKNIRQFGKVVENAVCFTKGTFYWDTLIEKLPNIRFFASISVRTFLNCNWESFGNFIKTSFNASREAFCLNNFQEPFCSVSGFRAETLELDPKIFNTVVKSAFYESRGTISEERGWN